MRKKKENEKVLTIPSLVADVEHRCGKGRRAGALGHSGVVKVTKLGRALALGVPDILTQHHVRHGYRGHALQHLHLQHPEQSRAPEEPTSALWLIPPIRDWSSCSFPIDINVYLLIPHVI